MMKNIIQRLGKAFRKSNGSNESLENKIDTQTVSIEEYNKAKEAFEKTKAEYEALTKENERIREETKSITTNIQKLQSEIRTQKITNILSGLTLTDERKQKLLETLVNSNLDIDTIKETYEPLKKNDSKNKETKLPQKSIPDHIR
jgi:chromosome segregation ATPase